MLVAEDAIERTLLAMDARYLTSSTNEFVGFLLDVFSLKSVSKPLPSDTEKERFIRCSPKPLACFIYEDKSQNIVDFMAVRIRARKVETVKVETVLPMVVEIVHGADYQRSGDIASEYNGTRIKLERLPQLLNSPEFVKSIEGTDSYKSKGEIWFWTGTVGTNLSGYCRINPQGKTLEKMFRFISKEFDSKVQAVPFNERAYFDKVEGSQPVAVEIRGTGFHCRLGVYNDYWLIAGAPVVVVEQAQAAEVGSFYKIGKEGVLEHIKATAKEMLRSLQRHND